MKITNTQRGFTLIEMLMYMVLLGFLLVIFVDLFATSIDVQMESQSVSHVNQDASFLLTRLSYDVQRAQLVTIPATAGASTNSLQITIDGINYTYALANGNLQVTNVNGTDVLNSFDTTISSITFQNVKNSIGKATIKIILTVTSRITQTSGTESKTIQTTIGLR